MRLLILFGCAIQFATLTSVRSAEVKRQISTPEIKHLGDSDPCLSQKSARSVDIAAQIEELRQAQLKLMRLADEEGRARHEAKRQALLANDSRLYVPSLELPREERQARVLQEAEAERLKAEEAERVRVAAKAARERAIEDVEREAESCSGRPRSPDGDATRTRAQAAEIERARAMAEARSRLEAERRAAEAARKRQQ